MKFKKIMSVFGGVAILLGATFAGAAIVNNGSLKPFPDSVLIYGEKAAFTDTLGAINIAESLSNSVIDISPNQTIITGEMKRVETSSQPLYLGDSMINTKTTFSKEQLPIVLADGQITDENGKDYDYNLKINVPNSKVIYGEGPDNLDPPIIYADFNSADTKYDMRIIFPTAVDLSLLTDEFITLFGKRYVFSSNSNDLTGQKMTLFENSKSIRVYDGESLIEGNNTFTVSVEDTLRAIVYVNGVSKSVKEGFSGKISGVNVYVKDVFGPDYLSTNQKRYVELYLNANSLVLKDGQEVSLANEDISGTRVEFTNNSGKVSEIKIAVTPSRLDNDVDYLKSDKTFTDPVFKTVKFYLQGITPSLEDNRDNIQIMASREDRVGVKFVNRLDRTYDLDVLRPSPIMLDANYTQMFNSTCTTEGITFPLVYGYNVDENGTIIQPPTLNLSNVIGNITQYGCSVPGVWTYNATQLGFDDKKIIVENNKDIKENDYFITTSGEYSQIWRIDDIKSDGKVEIRDIGADASVTISLGAVGGTGSLNLADGSSASIALKDINTIVLQDKASNSLYTKKGAKLILPNDGSGRIQIIEETPYNGGSFNSNNGTQLGNTLTFKWAYKNSRSGRDMFLNAVNYGTKDMDYWSGDVGSDDVYTITKYGTFIKQTGDEDKKLQIYYPEDAAKVSFYIGEQGSEITQTPTEGLQIVTMKDSEIESYKNRNIVVVGGSCINAVAAALLGEERPICGAEFTEKTGVTDGHYLIQAFKNPWNQDKIAVLVAGYNAEDTTRAVNDILSKPMDLSVGNKIIG